MSPWRKKHWRHVLMLGLLVFTGFALFIGGWRSRLGPALPFVQGLHEWGGLLYSLALVGWARLFFPWPQKTAQRPKTPSYAAWGYFFLVMLAVSGGGLLVGPSATRSVATVVHGVFASALMIWIVWHLVTRIPRLKKAAPQGHGPVYSRRRMIRWGASLLVSLPILEGLPGLLKMVLGRTVHTTSTSDALPGFVPYTVTGQYPAISRDAWHLKVVAHAKVQKVWHFADLDRFPKRVVVYNFHCVTGWVVPHVTFTGVDLADLLEASGWERDHEPWVTFSSGDGIYTDTLSRAQIDATRPLLATTIDGRPLPRAQGYPMRLLVPSMYGYKSVKWLVAIEMGRQASPGYWEQRGYPQNATIGPVNSL